MEILSREAAMRKLQRMAYEIAETNPDEHEIVLAGIKENGVILAHVLMEFLKPVFKGEIKMIEVDINKKHPQQAQLHCGVELVSFDDKVIIIVDDVANSGKTLSYALKPFLNYYPSKIQTLVLVERSHKRFPVTPDFKGLSIATALSEKIVVDTHGGEITGAHLEA